MIQPHDMPPRTQSPRLLEQVHAALSLVLETLQRLRWTPG